MTWAHRYIGLAIGVAFLLLFLFGTIAWIRNKDPGKPFWGLLAAGQGALVLQAVVGIILFLMGGRRPILHYTYGAFPVLVLVAAHLFSRRLKGIEWTAFTIAGLFIFGLQLRGFMTGF